MRHRQVSCDKSMRVATRAVEAIADGSALRLIRSDQMNDDDEGANGNADDDGRERAARHGQESRCEHCNTIPFRADWFELSAKDQQASSSYAACKAIGY